MFQKILEYIFILFFVQPLVEYFSHRSVHLFKLNVHKNLEYSKYIPSTFLYYISFTGFLIIPRWLILWLSILKYQAVHEIVHYTDVLPLLRDHHELHHKYPSYNFGISAKWPDKLFCTLKK